MPTLSCSSAPKARYVARSSDGSLIEVGISLTPFLDELCSQGDLAVWLDDVEGAGRLVAVVRAGAVVTWL
jgi:hypothetical protein